MVGVGRSASRSRSALPRRKKQWYALVRKPVSLQINSECRGEKKNPLILSESRPESKRQWVHWKSPGLESAKNSGFSCHRFLGLSRACSGIFPQTRTDDDRFRIFWYISQCAEAGQMLLGFAAYLLTRNHTSRLYFLFRFGIWKWERARYSI